MGFRNYLIRKPDGLVNGSHCAPVILGYSHLHGTTRYEDKLVLLVNVQKRSYAQIRPCVGSRRNKGEFPPELALNTAYGRFYFCIAGGTPERYIGKNVILGHKAIILIPVRGVKQPKMPLTSAFCVGKII